MIKARALWAAAASLLLAACTAGSAPTSTPSSLSPTPVPASASRSPAATVTMRDDGCEFSGPAQLTAGMVVLGLENQSRGSFIAHLWLLNSGHSYDELARHVAEEQRRADAGEPGLGHPTFARLVAETSVAAERGTMESRLAPGTYGLACILFEGGEPVRMWAAGPFAITE